MTNKEFQTPSNLNDILTEEEVLRYLGVKKAVLDDFRLNMGLPFCKLTKTRRLYIADDILQFISNTRTTLNKGH